MYHECHAIGCTEQIKPELLFCKKHWEMLPINFKKNVKKYYRRGQEKDKKPSIRYMKSHYAAVNKIAAKERKHMINVSKRLNFLMKHKVINNS